MGRQNGDSTMVSSSIALLQERFRELQKVREKRQEKELLKLFSSESERIAPSIPIEPSKVTLQPEMILPNRPLGPPHLQDSLLSLALNSQTQHTDFKAMKSPTSLWPNTGSSSSNFENSDVDTSLHL